jgi:hypothetical protein
VRKFGRQELRGRNKRGYRNLPGVTGFVCNSPLKQIVTLACRLRLMLSLTQLTAIDRNKGNLQHQWPQWLTATFCLNTIDRKGSTGKSRIAAPQLRATGFTDLARALETAEPELNFNRPFRLMPCRRLSRGTDSCRRRPRIRARYVEKILPSNDGVAVATTARAVRIDERRVIIWRPLH